MSLFRPDLLRHTSRLVGRLSDIFSKVQYNPGRSVLLDNLCNLVFRGPFLRLSTTSGLYTASLSIISRRLSSSIMSNTQSRLYQTLNDTASKTLLSYSPENCGSDISSLSSTLSPTCKRHFAPASLFATMPEMANHGMSNTEYEAQMAPEIGTLETWRIEIKKIVVDEAKRTAMAWSHNYLTMKGRKEVLIEFVFMLDMNETGDKVDKIVQFVDTAECAKYVEIMKEVMKEQQA